MMFELFVGLSYNSKWKYTKRTVLGFNPGILQQSGVYAINKAYT